MVVLDARLDAQPDVGALADLSGVLAGHPGARFVAAFLQPVVHARTLTIDWLAPPGPICLRELGVR